MMVLGRIGSVFVRIKLGRLHGIMLRGTTALVGVHGVENSTEPSSFGEDPCIVVVHIGITKILLFTRDNRGAL